MTPEEGMNLATHPWAEPGEGTVVAARATGSRIALPRPGEPFEPTAETVPSEPWWRAVAQAPSGGWPTADVPTKAAIKTTADSGAEADGKSAEGTGEPETVPAG